MVDFSRFMPPGGLPLDIKFPTPVPVGVSPPPAVQPAPVKPPRGDAIKVPIKQPPLPVKPPRAEPVKVPIKQPPLPLPGESGPIIANPGVPPMPMPPVEPQIPMPAPVPLPQVPAPVPLPGPVPPPIDANPGPAPVPQVPVPTPPPQIPNPIPTPIPELPTQLPLPPAPPVNELPPPIQVPPPINVPAPPDDIVSRGTVGPVAPPPVEVPPPVMMPEPVGLPADFQVPEDILSRGTVGPVAPPPVDVPPPVMQPTPEPVAPTPQRADPPPAIFDPGPVPPPMAPDLGGVSPPIPLAPSQPGVPTPMAPGSFQGVLPGPQPEPEAPPLPTGDSGLSRMLTEPFALPTFGRVGEPNVAQVQPVEEEPTGIETMAPAVGFGDYLGNEVAEAMPTQASQDTIALPDGSSFDLSTLDIGGFTGEGFDISDISLGQAPAQPAPAQSAPVEEGTGFDPAGRFRGEGFDFELPVDDSQTTSPNTGSPTFSDPIVVTDYFQLHDALGSGVSLDQIDTSNLSGFDPANIGQDRPTDASGFNPEDYTAPAGEFMTDGQLAEYGSLEPGTPIPTNPTNTGLTPEQQAALDQYLADNPGAFDFIGSGFNPFGSMSGVGAFGSIPTGTVSDGQGSYTVIPVGPVGDLDNTGGQATAPGPINVRSASSYGLTGAQPTMPVGPNPFQRPETQEGIGSLAGGG
jgi:hypothetical protein